MNEICPRAASTTTTDEKILDKLMKEVRERRLDAYITSDPFKVQHASRLAAGSPCDYDARSRGAARAGSAPSSFDSTTSISR